MTEDAQYVTLLVVSTGLTFLVGRLLVRAGEPYLLEVFHDRKVTRSVNLLLSVLFYLVTLGVLAMISVVEIDVGSPLQTFVAKLGVVLLTLGIAYGISMLVLIRVRERRRASEISEHVQERLAERGIGVRRAQAEPPVVVPPPGQPPVAGGELGRP
jgi:hypothetical protein